MKVLRYPDRFPAGIYYWYAIKFTCLIFVIKLISVFWTSHHEIIMHLSLATCRSHHEKIVIVDHHICHFGGLDLCFGRYDTPEHKVGDFPPSVWPGKDYYNPR